MNKNEILDRLRTIYDSSRDEDIRKMILDLIIDIGKDKYNGLNITYRDMETIPCKHDSDTRNGLYKESYSVSGIDATNGFPKASNMAIPS